MTGQGRRLTLVHHKPPSNTSLNLAHRASATEGEAVKRLLEDNGYTVKGPSNGQFTSRCPFHEGPGAVERNKGANFYIAKDTSKFYCQSASCGQRGNLRVLEKHFGLIDTDDEYVAAYRSRDVLLKEFELNLVPALRTPFYEHGLTDDTIARFRLGYQPEHVEDERTIPARYVIPYLENRRPKFFRYYSPDGPAKWKYTWETGSEATLFNPGDAVGDEKRGIVIICEGEQKAMLLCQLGYAAVAVPGAANWKDEYASLLTHARRILICYDNDNPAHPENKYDKPEKDQRCQKCQSAGMPGCIGHNPGQEQALKRLEQLGWRAKNVVLPWPEQGPGDEPVKKTDVNDFFMRDGNSNADFAELATGKRSTPFKVASLAEIIENPPEESEMLVEQGILTVGGRTLIAGKPKVGKSILLEHLALSLCSGLPFLRGGAFRGFKVADPTRVLLLDRELSKRSLFDRLIALTTHTPALQAAHENLLIDHDNLLKLDHTSGAYDLLCGMVEENGAQVVMLDTAYKFFNGDVESQSSVAKAFEVLDKVIHETGVAFVLTHHMRKSAQAANRKDNTDIADPDSVVGSFLWTGWPNATILLNYKDRSVENPFNAVATFAAFRDAPAPEPLALYRSRDSIAYSAVEPFSYDSEEQAASSRPQVIMPDTTSVENLLLQCVPTVEEDFLHMAAGHFGVAQSVIKPYFIDAMYKGNFERTSSRPPIIQFKGDLHEEESWEKEHGLKETKIPANAGAGFEDVPMLEGF